MGAVFLDLEIYFLPVYIWIWEKLDYYVLKIAISEVGWQSIFALPNSRIWGVSDYWNFAQLVPYIWKRPEDVQFFLIQLIFNYSRTGLSIVLNVTIKKIVLGYFQSKSKST
jgi:hypothetical protein